MSAFSDYLEIALLNATLRGTAYISPISLELALFTTDPTDANVGTEVTGSGYARQTVTFGPPEDNGSGGMKCSNDVVVSFTANGGSWGEITHWGLFDNDGNLLYHGALTIPKTVNDGDTLKFDVGNLSISLQ